jgi:hypothetical protein
VERLVKIRELSIAQERQTFILFGPSTNRFIENNDFQFDESKPRRDPVLVFKSHAFESSSAVQSALNANIRRHALTKP